jgi:two-component system NtrC family sensor kinase
MISRLGDISLRAKITVSFVLIVICGTSISTFLGSRIITRAMLNEALKQIRHGLQSADMVFTGRVDAVRKSVAGAAEAEQLAAALESGGKAPLSAVLARIRDRQRLHFLSFIDAGKRSIYRASQATGAPPDTGPLPIPDFMNKAMSGDSIAGPELFSPEALLHEDRALADRARMKILPDRTSPEAGVLESGMVLVAAVPVNTAAGFKGVLYGGILLNRDEDLVTQIDGFVFGSGPSANGSAGVVSIFLNNVRIATNILDDSGQREVGKHAPDDIYREVLSRGIPNYSRAHVAGSWHLTACKPILDHTSRMVGMLGVGVREEPFMAVRTSMMLAFLPVAAVGVLVVLVITYFITRSMIFPLEEMVKASNRIAAGDLNHSVRISSNDEIGILANSFNKMLASIKTMKLELEEWGKTLEEKVNKRTEELVAVKTRMAQSEKLASIGRLAAGVAHEINNPLAGVLTFSMLALEDCGDDHPMKPSLEVIVKQTLRCRETVKGLLDFARQSSATPSITDVNSVVSKTLQLLENQAIFQNIRTVRDFGTDLPNVFIDAGELQQVVVNIILNAVDAMEENGTLTLETCQMPAANEVLIRIGDTGKGIPDDVLPLIFEPFFTTKKVGKGTGLGLAIVHGIVTRAGGKIEVASSPRGATFTIRLPIAPEDRKKDAKDGQSQQGPRPGVGKSA